MIRQCIGRLVPAVLLLLMVAGCQSVRTTPAGGPGDETASATTAPAPATADDGQVMETGGAMTDEPSGSRVELIPGTGELVNLEALARNRQQGTDAEGEARFNFEGVSLQEVVKAILGDWLGENYVIAPGVGGEVTFSTSKPVSAEQAMPILEMLLSWNNASLVYMDGRYHVLPKSNAIKGQLTPTTAPLANVRGYQVRAYPLDFISPTEMEKLLMPYVKDGAIISADNARGLLTIAGTSAEHQNYLQTIDIFDVDWLAGMSVGIYPLERVEAATVVTELEAVFGEAAGTPLAGMFRFMPIERLNAVLVITPQSEYLRQASDWVSRLDRGGSEAGTRLYVYEVRNVKAVDLADTLSQVFGGSGGRRSERQRGQLAPGLQAGEIRSINDPRGESDSAANTAQTPARSNQDGGSGVALVDGDEIGITAVEESNSLLIRATPQQYDAVLAAVKRLDIEPLQVHIEAQVLEVTLNDNLSYGVEWFLQNAAGSTPNLFGNNGSPDSGNGDGNGDGGTSTSSRLRVAGKNDIRGVFGSGIERFGRVGGGGLSFSIAGADAGAVISLLESITEIRSISAPSLMVLNNREANINVGDQIPVNSVSVQSGIGTSTNTTTQFRDTGTTLSILPRVNPGGLVFMEIDQEVSAAVPGSGDGNSNLTVSRRTISTEVAVQSGQTIVLGGLIQTSDSVTNNGVPVLKEIPLLGGLFSSKSHNQTRQELLVLIKPTVADSQSKAREISNEYRSKMIGLEPFDFEKVQINVKPKY